MIQYRCLLIIILFFIKESSKAQITIDSFNGRIQTLAINGSNTNRIKTIDLLSSMFTNNQKKLDTLIYEYIDGTIRCNHQSFVSQEKEFIEKYGSNYKNVVKKYSIKEKKLYNEGDVDTNTYIRINIVENDTSNKNKKDYWVLKDSLPPLSHKIFLKVIDGFVSKIISVPQNHIIYPWVQDAMIVSNTNNCRTFHVQKDDSVKIQTSLQFSLHLNAKLDISKMQIDGGNVLLLDSLSFVGVNNKNSLDSTFVHDNCSKHIIWVGFEKYDALVQPMFHIDLFLNVFTFNNKMVLLFSKFLEPKDSFEMEFNTTIEKTIQYLKPQLLKYIDSQELIIDSLPISKDFNYRLYSFSNAVFETSRKGNRFVYLPAYYNTSITDSTFVSAVFEKYNIKASFIDGRSVPLSFCNVNESSVLYYGYTRDMQNQGALHCQVKVIKRSFD